MTSSFPVETFHNNWAKYMSEKQAYIFFISDSQVERWHRNREITLFYLNRITVSEEYQCEVLLVVDDKNLPRDIQIQSILDAYQAQVKGAGFKMRR